MSEKATEKTLTASRVASKSSSKRHICLWSDIPAFISLVQSCTGSIAKGYKKAQIQKILNATGWIEHYRNKATGRRVLSESATIEHLHEKNTAIYLTQWIMMYYLHQ
jgi:hypothetical protein